MPRVESSADVAMDARIGDGSVAWHLAQVREGAVVGQNCMIGRGADVEAHVAVGAAVDCGSAQASTAHVAETGSPKPAKRGTDQ